MLLAANQTAQQIFGTIKPQGPIGALSMATILSWGLRIFFFAMGMLALYYMLMGAFEWTSSGGEEKKIEAAKAKITQSLIAMLISIVILVGWIFLSSQILGIFKFENGQFTIKIPTISCKQAGITVTNASDCCSGTVTGAGVCD